MTRIHMQLYRGYRGTATLDYGVWTGKVDHIREPVQFTSLHEDRLQDRFEEAVDQYFEDCRLEGVEPEQPRY